MSKYTVCGTVEYSSLTSGIDLIGWYLVRSDRAAATPAATAPLALIEHFVGIVASLGVGSVAFPPPLAPTAQQTDSLRAARA